jgi:drug/metabolite transporter (DMT)-like permease
MTVENNVIEPTRITPNRAGSGIALGALGVLGFSMSLPATRLAVAGMDPWFVAFGRAAGAGLLALVYLVFTRGPRPSTAQAWRLGIVAIGVVVGFPVLTSFALHVQTAAHGSVVVAVLPASTAVFAVIRAGERPSAWFWVTSAVGLLATIAFAAGPGAAGGLEFADALLLGAVVLCGLGYAEGGVLARDLGGANTICWALVLSLPITLPIAVVTLLATQPRAAATAWLGFGYVTVVSMFLGFFAWYAGLARGGVARVGQVQLAQPVLSLVWAVLLLGERVTSLTVATAFVVLVCVAATQLIRRRARVTAEQST